MDNMGNYQNIMLVLWYLVELGHETHLKLKIRYTYTISCTKLPTLLVFQRPYHLPFKKKSQCKTWWGILVVWLLLFQYLYIAICNLKFVNGAYFDMVITATCVLGLKHKWQRYHLLKHSMDQQSLLLHLKTWQSPYGQWKGKATLQYMNKKS